MKPKTSKLTIELISLVLLAFLASSFFLWRLRLQSSHPTPIVFDNTTDTTVADQKDPILNIAAASQISPDGTKKITLRTIPNPDGSKVYKVTTIDGLGKNEQTVYKSQFQGSEKLSVPFNSWSPDNKYLFVQKNGSDALVFTNSGDPIASPDAYFDVSNIFKERGEKNLVSQVTGWASPTLLIVNTTTPDNTKGPSYWLEIPSKAIIQLSSQF